MRIGLAEEKMVYERWRTYDCNCRWWSRLWGAAPHTRKGHVYYLIVMHASRLPFPESQR